MSFNASKEERKAAVNRARVASIQAKYEEAQKAKEQIADALKGINKPSKNRIVFDSDSDENIESRPTLPPPIKDHLKGDDIMGFNESGDEEIEFKVKKQFEGKHGHKLMEAQAKIGQDLRFQLDERFAQDSESDSSSEDERNKNVKNNELKKNLTILQEVLGVKSKELLSQKKKLKFDDPTKKRYDPTKEDSKRLEKSMKPQKPKSTVQEKKIIEEPKSMPGKYFQASYSSLKQTFAQKSGESRGAIQENNTTPFSFSLMFNNENIEADKPKELDKNYQTLPTDDDMKFNAHENAEAYSSSETEEEEMEVETNKVNFEEDRKPKTFFINSCSDPRVMNGVKQFLCNKSDEEITSDWLAVRDILINEYKRKHKDAKRRWHDK